MDCPCHKIRRKKKRIFRKVTHCIFDLDGLLLDTERINENIVKDICRKYDKEYTWELRVKVLGTVERKGAETIVTELDLPITVDEFLKQYHQLSNRKLRHAQLLPGAERLLRHLHKNRIPMALATSSTEDMVRIKTENHRELFRVFRHKVFGGTDPEIREGKPAPDIFFIAAQRFKPWVCPMDCLVFEDSLNGILAAKAAKMQTVMVPDDRLSREEMRKIANEVLYSLEYFRPELYGLPPFPK